MAEKKVERWRLFADTIEWSKESQHSAAAQWYFTAADRQHEKKFRMWDRSSGNYEVRFVTYRLWVNFKSET
jgi:hypothetical protein